MMNRELDDKDRLLLEHLQVNARMSNAELARQIELSGPGLQKRLRRLEDSGVIERYVALVNRETVGFDMLCFVQVTLARHQPEAIARFRQVVGEIPEVLECFHITGEYDYLLKVVVRNRKHLEQFLMERLTPVSGMDKIRTSLVLSDIKMSTVLPLNGDLLDPAFSDSRDG